MKKNVRRLLSVTLCVVAVANITGKVLQVFPSKSAAAPTTDEASVLPKAVTPYFEGEAYYDTSLTFEERAVALVSQMTNEEKVTQLNTSAPAIPRLGVPSYGWWNESIRGLAWTRGLSFPTGVSLSMSWDDELMFEQASIIGDECRAAYRADRRGLSQFNPTINLARDPRWGRNEEGFGEDPYMVGRLGAAYVRGIQGENDSGSEYMSDAGEKYVKAIATPKHYAANNSEFDRYVGDSQMDERELREYYTYHFRYAALHSNPGSVMTAYNRVNSVPMFAHTYLNNTLLRKMWGFTGYIVSDCDGIANIRNDHQWDPRVSYPDLDLTGITGRVTEAQAAAYSIMGGTDLSCNWTSSGNTGGFYGSTNGGGNVKSAVEQGVITDNGLMTWDAVDRALVRMFTQRMATGEFDKADQAASGAAGVANRNVGGAYGEYTQATHRETAYGTAKSLEASRKGITLLRNEDNILPLNLETNRNIAVVGKFLDRCELGDNNYASNPSQRTTYRQGITNILNAKGFDTTNNLKFYAPTAGSTVSGNIMNVRNLTINGTSYDASSSDSVVDGQKSGSNIENIRDRGYALFSNLDLTGGEVKSFSVEVATGSATGNWKPVVELRMGGPTGQLVSRVECERTSGLQNYTVNVGDITGGIVHGAETLCLLFTTTDFTSKGMTAVQLNEIANADVVIYIAGTAKDPASLDVARENRDRVNMNLPADQADEIRAILKMNENVILPIQSVGMLNITEFVKNSDPAANAKAVLFTGFNGQFQGTAMAEVLFGDVNPTGRLAFTWYEDEAKMPSMPSYTSNQRGNPVDVDYSIRPRDENSWGRTYQYYTGPVLYPFGYGLCYSTFEYSNPRISKTTLSTAEELYIEVDVKNTSEVDGTEVVQIYMVPPQIDGVEMPFRQLKGYTRADIPAGETKTVRVDLNTDDWWFYDDATGERMVYEGDYVLEIAREATGSIEAMSVATFTGANSVDLTGLTSTQLNVAMPYQNEGTSSVDLDMYVAVYDGNGKLAHMAFDSKSLNPSETKTFNATIDMPQNIDGLYKREGYTAKVFLWHNSSLEPVMKAIDAFANTQLDVTINETVEPWIQNVNLDTDVISITATRNANAELFIALSNDTFLANDDADSIVFTSNRPEVAEVNQEGVVTRTGPGTAVITATVRYKGETMSGSFSVVSE